jgi:hypothetical protein
MLVKLNAQSVYRIGLVFLSALGLVLLIAPSNSMAQTEEVKVSEEELKRYEGNYKVNVHPEPFGFFVKDGKLYLKMGGLEGSGQEVPLMPQGEGKFVIDPDHPNVFEFKVKGDMVEFTLYSMGNPIPGYRLEKEKPTEPYDQKPDKALEAPRKAEKTRADILAEIAKLEPKFKKDPSNAEVRFKYGELLYQSGEFWQARDVIAPLVKGAQPSAEALSLAAKLEYLLGNYGEAEKLYKRLIEDKAGEVSGQVMAKVGLVFTYYQTNQYDKVKELEFPPGVKLPNLEQMKEFEEKPYQKEWHNEEKVSVVPFLMTDPLPVLTVEFNGVPVQVIFDTGADAFILDNEIAAAMGIEWGAKVMGTFGGGLKAEVGFGKVNSVKLGDVTLKQVPIAILPTKRFSPAFDGGKYILGGFIGTAALRQFLSTLDYKNGRLVLRERTKESAHQLREELKERIAAEVPFVLSATHMMMARGSLNDIAGLTFFVDSGLASEACFTAPIQTLEYVGIPVPETKISEDSVGGGGGKWASGLFSIKTIGLGSLTQSEVKGGYGEQTQASYWRLGFIQDGLISHRFLRHYSSWTLDFDAMSYIFEK